MGVGSCVISIGGYHHLTVVVEMDPQCLIVGCQSVKVEHVQPTLIDKFKSWLLVINTSQNVGG
jgi:hypothetical protein